MVNRSIIVVVILEKGMGFVQDGTGIRRIQSIFLDKVFDDVPNAFVNVQIVHQNIIDDIAEIGDDDFLRMQHLVNDRITNDVEQFGGGWLIWIDPFQAVILFQIHQILGSNIGHSVFTHKGCFAQFRIVFWRWSLH